MEYYTFRSKQQQQEQIPVVESCRPHPEYTMTKRIYRGIAVIIASLLVASPQVALGEEDRSYGNNGEVISSRFSAALERADAASASSGGSVDGGSLRRRELSWWSIALQFGE